MSPHRAANDEPLIDAALLDALLRAIAPMSVEALALQRSLSPAQVLRELDRLRAADCLLDEHPQLGLTLVRAGLPTWVDYLRSLSPRPRVVEVYRRTASTQDIGRRLVEAHGHASDAALAVADEQTAGRGRLGRTWVAPPGAAVTFSRVCLLDGARPGSAVDRLTFATSVAVAAAVEALLAEHSPPGTHPQVMLKWPNDVIVDGRKIAGILVETFQAKATAKAKQNVRAAIVGVGLNVALQPAQLPEDEPGLRERVTSLAMLGASVDRLRVLGEVVRSMDEALERTPAATLLEQWRRRCAMLHQPLRVRSAGRVVEGQVLDLDPYEGLILRTASGQIVHLPAATTTVV